MSACCSCFNAQADIFAIMNCCVVALNVFSSDILTWNADSLYSVQWHIRRVRVEDYVHCFKELWENVGSETWIWRQIVTSQAAHHTQMTTICHWMNPPPFENFLRIPLNQLGQFLVSFTWKTCPRWANFICLTGGVATILCYCAKLLFMLLPSVYGIDRGLKHYILYCLENDNFRTS